MISELSVRDFGIIREMNWCPHPAMNVITGETGAGKSLVIDAVEALLGGHTGEEMIRHGAMVASIEGIFRFLEDKDLIELKQLLSEQGLDEGEEQLIIHCELRRNGRSVYRVNGHAVTRNIINNIGQLLVDIHGQSEHLSLLKKEFHLDFLDGYAHTMALRQCFTEKLERLKQVERELKEITSREANINSRRDFLKFQIDEIEKADLKEGDEEELINERNVLASFEQLKALSLEAYENLNGDDSLSTAALEKLSTAAFQVKKLAELDATLKEQSEYLEQTVAALEETARDVRSYSEGLEYDPARLEEIELRLQLINNLKRKYGQSITEILAYGTKAASELLEIDNSSEKHQHLSHELTRLKEEMGTLAAELSEKRNLAAMELEAVVGKELHDLAMSRASFSVAFSRKTKPDGIPLDDETYAYNTRGVDELEFMAATNPGEPCQPLVRIASTGEISRFMLALKAAFAGTDNIPILIFDEIDIGVGARSGEVIARKLRNLSRSSQVICVTHLPQIAAFADAQYCVQKETSSENRTVSLLKGVTGEERLREIAEMIAGPGFNESAITSAKDLLRHARESA